MAVGLNVSVAGASGESTTAVLTSPPAGGSSTTFTWSYEFHSNGGHDLSNIAISLCSTGLLPLVVSASPAGEVFLNGDVPGGHAGFGPGIKFATTAVSGTLTVVFSQAQTAGGSIQVQSHSGDGQAGDQITTASGPGNCNPTTTTVAPSTTTTVPATTTTVPATTTTVPATTTTVPATTTTVPATTTTVPATTTTVPATTTTVPATTTTLPATTTTVAGATTTTVPVTTTTALATTTTVPATTTSVAGNRISASSTTVPAQTTTSVPTSVLGARFTNDDNSGDLAKTGFNGAPLVAFGLVLLVLGLALVVGDKLQPAEG